MLFSQNRIRRAWTFSLCLQIPDNLFFADNQGYELFFQPRSRNRISFSSWEVSCPSGNFSMNVSRSACTTTFPRMTQLFSHPWWLCFLGENTFQVWKERCCSDFECLFVTSSSKLLILFGSRKKCKELLRVWGVSFFSRLQSWDSCKWLHIDFSGPAGQSRLQRNTCEVATFSVKIDFLLCKEKPKVVSSLEVILETFVEFVYKKVFLWLLPSANTSSWLSYPGKCSQVWIWKASLNLVFGQLSLFWMQPYRLQRGSEIHLEMTLFLSSRIWYLKSVDRSVEKK